MTVREHKALSRAQKNLMFLVAIISGGSVSADISITYPSGGATVEQQAYFYGDSQYNMEGQTSGAVLTGNMAFPGGIALPGSGTSNTPVHLTSPLRFGGQLGSPGSDLWYLGSDFQTDSTFNLYDTLNIYGGGNAMKLSNTLFISDANSSGLYILGNLIIDGQGNSIVFMPAESAHFRVDKGISVTLRNMTLYFGTPNVIATDDMAYSPGTGQPIACEQLFGSGKASLTLDNVTIVLPNGGLTYVFPGYGASKNGIFGESPGYLFVKNTVRLIGARGATFQFGCSTSESMLPLVVLPDSELIVGPGVNFYYKPYADYSPSSDNSLIRMMDSTSRLCLDNCSLTIPNGVGLQILKGMVTFDNLVHIANTGATSTSSKGVIFGDGTVDNNVDVRVLSGATIIVDGFLQYAHS